MPENLDETSTFGDRVPTVEYENRKAAYAVILRDGKVATVRSNSSGNYFLPGGGAWAGESSEATVLREIAEELGCEGKLTGRIGEAIQFFHAAGEDKHYRMEAAFFTAELAGEPNFTGAASGEELLYWLTIGEAQARLFHACHVWAVNEAI